MRLAYDFAPMESKGSGRRGIGRFVFELGKAMQAELLADGDEFLALDYAVDWEMLPDVRRAFGQSQLRHIHTPQPRGHHGDSSDALRPAGSELVADYYKSLDADVIFVGSLFEGFGTSISLPNSYKGTGKYIAAAFHDLIPLIFANQFLSNQDYRNWYYDCLERVKSCDLLLANSEATRQDVIRLLDFDPDCIVTVGVGVDSKFRKLPNPSSDAVKQRYGIEKKFVFDVGNVEWTKNLPGLIAGWGHIAPEIRQDRQLVIVCSNKGLVQDLACQNGLGPEEVIATGYVSDDDLVELYNACDLFVIPSLYEGFGSPAVEAMRCGAVVMGAKNSSLIEVVGHPEALFDAENPENIASVISKGLMDEELRGRLREFGAKHSQKYTWQSAARKSVQAITEGLAKKRGMGQ